MAGQRHADGGIQGQGMGLKRRGLIAGAAALVVGIVAKQASEPVAAVTYSLQGDTGSSIINVAHDRTLIIANGTFPASTPVFDAELTGGSFTIGTDIAAGVKGASNRDAGVWGVTAAAGKPGVYGTSISARTGIGVQGVGEAAGVIGQSFLGIGVQGSVPGSNFQNTMAVQGLNQSTGANAIGVQGQITGNATNTVAVKGINQATGDGGIGVRGDSTGGIGVYGYAGAAGTTQVVAGMFGDSAHTYGVIGRTTAAGYSGLTAITGTAGVAALAATSTNANAYAAYFTGTTVVQGNFVAFGGSKSAAVKDASGQHRLVYCMESLESCFEDFGSGKLVNGTSDVKLDPVFSQIVHTDDYGVFLTPEGDCNGLYVTGKTPGGFSVRELRNGTSMLAFRYRVVAKRNDIKGERLAKFTPPKINIPDESKLPKPEPPRAVPSPLPPTKP